MTLRPGRRGGKLWPRADSGKPDDTRKPEVAAGRKKCHGALAPLPNRGISGEQHESAACRVRPLVGTEIAFG